MHFGEHYSISIQIGPNFVPIGSVDNKSSLI